MTEYLWSDRYAYEVTQVIDQKHVFVRRMKAKNVGGAYGNDWVYEHDLDSPEIELIKRSNGWYRVTIYNKAKMMETAAKRVDKGDISANPKFSRDDQINIEFKLMLIHCNMTNKQLEKFHNGKEIKRYNKWDNISFGVMDEYYDWEF